MAPPLARAARLWSDWLGPAGSRPPPLDRFLGRALRDDRAGADVAPLVFATGAWAVTALVGLHGMGAEQLPTEPTALLDRLRLEDPGPLVGVSARLAGLAEADRQIWRRAERALGGLRRREDLPARLVMHGIPPGWAEPLRPRLERWGPARANSWLAAQCHRPPLWARPGGDQPPEAVAKALRADGFAVRVSGAALRVEGPRSIRSARAFRDGRVEVQDLASQAVAPLLEVQPGQRVWDMCAGRGGKTVQLARDLAGRGVLWATDTDPRALADLKARLRRTGHAGSVRILAWDGTSPPDFGREGRGGPDRVLVDAPCGASGTWRRNPDARLRPPEGTPADWAATQRALLAMALDVVRPGGRVVYATCSVLTAEDEDVVEAVAADRPEITVRATGLHGCPDRDADTLFAAVLERA